MDKQALKHQLLKVKKHTSAMRSVDLEVKATQCIPTTSYQNMASTRFHLSAKRTKTFWNAVTKLMKGSTK